MLTITALQDLYIKLGGALTDTYEGIADGTTVGNMTLIPDLIEAIAQKAGAGGGSSYTETLLYATGLDYAYSPYSYKYILNIRTNEQKAAGGMDNITAEDLHNQIDSLIASGSSSQASTAFALKAMFYHAPTYSPSAPPQWFDDDKLLYLARLEVSGDGDDLFKAIADYIDEQSILSDMRRAIANIKNYYTKNEINNKGYREAVMLDGTFTSDGNGGITVGMEITPEELSMYIADDKEVIINGYLALENTQAKAIIHLSDESSQGGDRNYEFYGEVYYRNGSFYHQMIEATASPNDTTITFATVNV